MLSLDPVADDPAQLRSVVSSLHEFRAFGQDVVIAREEVLTDELENARPVARFGGLGEAAPHDKRPHVNVVEFPLPSPRPLELGIVESGEVERLRLLTVDALPEPAVREQLPHHGEGGPFPLRGERALSLCALAPILRIPVNRDCLVLELTCSDLVLEWRRQRKREIERGSGCRFGSGAPLGAG